MEGDSKLTTMGNPNATQLRVRTRLPVINDVCFNVQCLTFMERKPQRVCGLPTSVLTSSGGREESVNTTKTRYLERPATNKNCKDGLRE